MDTSQYWAALRGRAWLVIMCALLGLGGALGYHMLRPPAYQAVALVRVHLLSNPQDPKTLTLTSDTLLNTEARAARGADVLNAASAIAGVPVEHVRAGVEVQPLTSTDLLQITTQAPTAQAAATLANAEAQALIQHEAAASQQENAAREQPLQTRITALEAEIRALQQRIATLEGSGETASDPQLGAFLTQLSQDQSTRLALTTSLAQLQFMEAQRQPSFTIQQAAEAATASQRPSLRGFLLAGLLGGAALGLLLAYALAARGRRLQAVADIRQIAGEVALIEIALAAQPTSGVARAPTPEDGGDPGQTAIAALATQLRFADIVRPRRLILVTGERGASGASFTAASLATHWAASGKRVLLVDAHLDRPTQHARFGGAESAGLLEALDEVGNRAGTLASFLLPTPTNHLMLLPAGRRPPNQAALLASSAMGRVLDAALASPAELIIVDGPPLTDAGGAAALATRADGVVLVVDRTRATDNTLRQALETLRVAQADLVALVLTDPTRHPPPRTEHTAPAPIGSAAISRAERGGSPPAQR
ncbi:MAG: CpsD/CapB family tyrosine-protein kinase [Ktedonobacterales bacterium]|nr:CpsD/CapB family tyrosine-protein kinase [Ktedonobacterales bacterium]